MPGEYEKKRLKNLSRLIVFVILFAFWLLFSGKIVVEHDGHYAPDYFHLILGVLSCGLVAWVSHDLLIRDMRPHDRIRKSWRFLLYVPWLIWQVVLANFHVALLVINPKRIHPKIVKYNTYLETDFSKVTFANSITLTPGTITMDIKDGEFFVHALSEKVADDLESGDMERRVAHVFYETKSDR